MSTLWDEIAPWIDKETGLMTAPDGGSDNLILMSAYLWRALPSADGLVPDTFIANIANFIDNTKVATGLNLRKPGDFAPQSIDNLIVLCYLRPFDAELVRFRWNSYFGCFDVSHPRRIAINGSWFARFIGVKSYIVAATGLKPWWIQRMLWIGSVFFTQWTTSGASDLLLLSLQVDVMEKYCPRTCTWWRKKNPLYPLYAQYFGETFPLTLAVKS